MVRAALTLLLATLAASLASASSLRRHANIPPRPQIPIIEAPDYLPADASGTALPPYDTWYYFDQLIDHNNPSLGTFKQRYYFTAEFYEPGGPIILMTPGEGNAEGYQGYLTNRTINGQIAQANKGATVVIEHRFFGYSNPYPDLSEKSFRVHTIDQAISDFVYFAKNAVLPMTNGSSVKAPDQAPWIWVGGSYSGALTSWIMHSHPNIFWAGYSSSGVVEAISYYWGYFEPIRQNMPQNCSSDVIKVLSHMDQVFSFGSKVEQTKLKTLFGMANISHLDDVAGALRNPIWEWQNLQPSTGPNSTFYNFCDALEVKNGVSAPAGGWGLKHALPTFGAFLKSYLESENFCNGPVTEECVGTYDPTLALYTDTALDNSFRSWEWFCCNEVGYWQDGAPIGWPSLVTRLVGPAYDNRQCSYFFPDTFPTIKSAKPNTSLTNKKFGGWDINTPRLFFANGKLDPWREATVSSDFHRRQSTDLQPILVGDGIHCSDLSTQSGVVDASIAKVQKSANEYFTKWLKEWPTRKGPNTVTTNNTTATARRDEGDNVIPASVINGSPAAVPAYIAQAPQTGTKGAKGSVHVLNNGFTKSKVTNS